MREIIKRGANPKEVINDFMKEMNIQYKDFEYSIEHKGSRGFLALFGKKDAVVKFLLPETEDMIKQYLKTLLDMLDIHYKQIEINVDKHTYYTHVKGVDNPGFLIGKEGKMLTSIQLLLNKVVDNEEHRNDNVVLDIDSYRARYANGADNKPRPKPIKTNIQQESPRKRKPRAATPRPAPRRRTDKKS